MKKIIAALLTLIMAMALFAGCGGDNGENNLPVNVGDTTPKPQDFRFSACCWSIPARRSRASRSAEPA